MFLSTPKTQIRAIIIGSVAVVVAYLGVKWQTSTLKSENLTQTEGSAMGNANPSVSSNAAPVDRIGFLTSLFQNSKPPAYIAKIILQNPADTPQDSLKLALKWAEETQNGALVAMLHQDLFMAHSTGTLTEVARELVFLGASQNQDGPVRSYLFQQGKNLIDKGLESDSRNMPLRNALLVYQSEYLNQPMAFVGTLKESQLIDSNDLELNFIHLNLLKKSNQMSKAIKKCEKLVSLQPQNPYWLFEMSDLYGQTGDSVNAKMYLNLAVKMQRNQN